MSSTADRALIHRILTLALAAVLGLAGQAAAQEPDHHAKVDPLVDEAIHSQSSVPVIVRFVDDESRERGRTLAGRRGRVGRRLPSLNGLSVEADSATIEALAADAGVDRISLDAPVVASASSVQRAIGLVTGNSGQSRNTRNSASAVAIIDSGVAPHADLPASRIRAFVDFVNGRTEPYDDFGHGTHVAGIVAGDGSASAGLDPSYEGVAPGLDIVALKVLDGTGAGRTSDVIAAIEWSVENAARYGVRVVNLSLGHPIYEPAWSDPLVGAVEEAARHGLVVVVSAGNMGLDPETGVPAYGGITSPANAPSAIAVGAVNTNGTPGRGDDTVTDYSSRGPTRFDLLAKPDLVAPGHRIVSLSAPGAHLFETYPSLQVPGASGDTTAYFRLSGTSMATPVVAATAALMLQANPELAANTVKALLQYTAEPLPGVDELTQGAGYLNGAGAVRLSGLVDPDTPYDEYWLTTAPPVPADQTPDGQIQWGQSVVWGNVLIHGELAYYHLRAWDDRVLWGSGAMRGDDDARAWSNARNVVWGNARNVVWGNARNVVWGNARNVVWGNARNVVWGNARNVVWGNARNVVWGNARNVVWGNARNVVWGNAGNVVWGNAGNVVWGNNVVWGFSEDTTVWRDMNEEQAMNVVWGNQYLDALVSGHNVVWGNARNVVWGNLAVLTGGD